MSIELDEHKGDYRQKAQFPAALGEEGIVSRETILQEFTDDFDAVGLLLQRELIEEVGDGYCFQVELMRRWFARGVR